MNSWAPWGHLQEFNFASTIFTRFYSTHTCHIDTIIKSNSKKPKKQNAPILHSTFNNNAIMCTHTYKKSVRRVTTGSRNISNGNWKYFDVIEMWYNGKADDMKGSPAHFPGFPTAPSSSPQTTWKSILSGFSLKLHNLWNRGIATCRVWIYYHVRAEDTVEQYTFYIRVLKRNTDFLCQRQS